MQHAISVRLFGGLAVAPVDKPRRVLDIGTGTGIWAIEFGRVSLSWEAIKLTEPADENPESDVLGTDLSPIQPE